jgi:hypothetical protein
MKRWQIPKKSAAIDIKKPCPSNQNSQEEKVIKEKVQSNKRIPYLPTPMQKKEKKRTRILYHTNSVLIISEP